MKFSEVLRGRDGISVDENSPHGAAISVDISGPVDGYQGATLSLSVTLPTRDHARIIQGRIVFPERIKFTFSGSLEALKKLVTRAPTARAFLDLVGKDDRFDTERE